MLTIALIFLAVTVITGVVLKRRSRGNGEPTLAQRLGQRLLSTVTPVMVGAAVGYVYATQTMPPELVRSSSLPALYASTGAISALLATRLFSLLRFMLSDRGRSDEPPT